MTRRTEFSTRTALKRWDHCEGRCEWTGYPEGSEERCNKKLFPGDKQLDHWKTCEEGGDNSFENARWLCAAHHSEKTHEHDTPRRVKSRSVRASHIGAKPKQRINPRVMRNSDRSIKEKLSSEAIWARKNARNAGDEQ